MTLFEFEYDVTGHNWAVGQKGCRVVSGGSWMAACRRDECDDCLLGCTVVV